MDAVKGEREWLDIFLSFSSQESCLVDVSACTQARGNSNLFWCLNNSSDQALGRTDKTRRREILILATNWDRCHNDWMVSLGVASCILKCLNIYFTLNKSLPDWSLPCFSSGGTLANSDWRSVVSRANDSQEPKRNGNVKTKTGMLTAIMGSHLVQTAKHSWMWQSGLRENRALIVFLFTAFFR